MVRRKRSSCAGSNTGCVIAYSAPGLHLVAEALALVRRVDRRRVDADADHEARRRADRGSARVEPAVEVRHQVRQPDRVDVEDRRRVGVGAPSSAGRR
jgi:hypothetical protein